MNAFSSIDVIIFADRFLSKQQSNFFKEFNMRRICVLRIILTLPERMEHYTLKKPFTTIYTVQKLPSTQSMVISIGEEI